MKRIYIQPEVEVFEEECECLIDVSVFPDDNADPNLPVNVKDYGMDSDSPLSLLHDLWDE